MIDIRKIAVISAIHIAEVSRAMARTGLIEDTIDATVRTSSMITECFIRIIKEYNKMCELSDAEMESKK